MGIRFACHVCEHKLNIKGELAGRRGICPACSSRFRIPLEDSEKSIPVDETASSEFAANDPNSLKNPLKNPLKSEIAANVFPADVQSSPTTILDDDIDGIWYVRPPSGGQYGPATTELLKQWIGEGRVAATSLIWRDGWPQWRDASEALPELVAKIPQSVSFPGSSSAPIPPAFSGSKRSTNVGAPATPTGPEHVESQRLSGNSSEGANRRKQSNRRIYTTLLLMAIVGALVAGLIFVVNR